MPEFLTRDVTVLGSILIVAIVSIAAVTDIRRRKIYNVLTMPAMALGFIVNGITDGPSGFLFSASGMFIGVALFLLPVALLGRGAGDLKLLAAVGTFGGPVFVFWCALLTGAAGSVFACMLLLRKRRLGAVVAGMALDVGSGQFPRATSRIRLPYAVPIAAGTFMTLTFF